MNEDSAGAPWNEIRPLGKALHDRRDEVVDRIVAASAASGLLLDDAVEKQFRRVGALSTIAVARWMSGEPLEDVRETGLEVWQIIGHLAAQRAATLTEVTKLCLRWREAACEIVTECGSELAASPSVVQAARDMLQQTLDLTLVHVCDSFEAERRHADDELAFLATHDPLTGLPNRTLILDRVSQMLARSTRSRTPVAALFIDLDNFKAINDTLGHSVGDELLRAVAARLDGVIRGADTLGRLGGDEFIVISEDAGAASGPELIAERLLEALRHPFRLGEDKQTRLTVTASIGIATGDSLSAEDLVRDADIAMYSAKWDGKCRYVVFESGMQHKMQSRMELEMDLREALSKDEFVLAYQPTVSLSDMSPNGVEALIRWHHPVRGVVQPNEFIPLLEETGLITEVGRWVLQQACSQGASWRSAGHGISIAVNVSGRQLDTDQIIADVQEALATSGLDPAALTIEITETTLMRNIEETSRRLSALKKIGVRIAIDDFGTGYSSLAHLQRFPVDALKIDRSFITGLAHNDEGETLIRTLVQLGKSLSIETFAEGIEEDAELSLLRHENCDSGQGFLFARPLSVEATMEFLRGFSLLQEAATASAPEPRHSPNT
jgi:diguanylate cyclase (GGDEF)-like protein